MTLAIFDIDGTLLCGASSERRFAAHLVRRRLVGPRQVGWYLLFMATQWPRYGIHTPKKNKAYLDGLTAKRIVTEANLFVEETLWPALDPFVVSTLRRHLDRGDRVVLLSGTLQPLAEALGERLGAHLSIGSGVIVRDGCYRQGLPQRHPFGRAKLKQTLELCREAGIPMAQVAAYGDSFHDRFLLESVGKPVAVNPDPPLRRLAQRLGWTVWDHGLVCDQPLPGPDQSSQT